MSEEFDLSKRILLSDKLKEFEYLPEMRLLDVEDVKEFIKRLKEDLFSAISNPETKEEQVKALDWVIGIINERAGNKLTGEENE